MKDSKGTNFDAISNQFLLTRAAHSLNLEQTAGDITSISTISRFESRKQRPTNSIFVALMNQIGLARQDVNNLLYAQNGLPFLEAHNEISELLVKRRFNDAEEVASRYEVEQLARQNPLATINTIELQTKIRRRREPNYQLKTEERNIVLKFFDRTHGVWTDHEYELYAHIATCIPIAKSYAIYRSISSRLRAETIASGYIPSFVFCIRNLMLYAIKEDESSVVEYVRGDAERIPLAPTSGDIDVYFIALTRKLCIDLANYMLTPNADTEKAAQRAVVLSEQLLGQAASQQAKTALSSLRQRYA